MYISIVIIKCFDYHSGLQPGPGSGERGGEGGKQGPVHKGPCEQDSGIRAFA